eukprot:6434465-Amphidinium_carterae.1
MPMRQDTLHGKGLSQDLALSAMANFHLLLALSFHFQPLLKASHAHSCIPPFLMASSEKERPMQTSIKRQRKTPRLLGVSLDGATFGPENKATALLITHRQRSETCRKPGTAFTIEYQTPGIDVRTLVVQAPCRNTAFIAISGLAKGNNKSNVLLRDQSTLDFS